MFTVKKMKPALLGLDKLVLRLKYCRRDLRPCPKPKTQQKKRWNEKFLEKIGTIFNYSRKNLKFTRPKPSWLPGVSKISKRSSFENFNVGGLCKRVCKFFIQLTKFVWLKKISNKIRLKIFENGQKLKICHFFTLASVRIEAPMIINHQLVRKFVYLWKKLNFWGKGFF